MPIAVAVVAHDETSERERDGEEQEHAQVVARS
jgi:hypothetical protein